MRKNRKAVRTAAVLGGLMLMALPVLGSAADKGHEGMQGMKMEGHGAAGHDMMKMGDKVFSGKVGPWTGEARIMDMKAHIEASGMKAAGPLPNSHHVAMDLSDAKTKEPVTGGKGTITVTGPDQLTERVTLMVMQGHFGADINLPKPGKYTIKAEIESGGRKGDATFSYTLK